MTFYVEMSFSITIRIPNCKDLSSRATALGGANYAAPLPCVKSSPCETEYFVLACPKNIAGACPVCKGYVRARSVDRKRRKTCGLPPDMLHWLAANCLRTMSVSEP